MRFFLVGLARLVLNAARDFLAALRASLTNLRALLRGLEMRCAAPKSGPINGC
jgi:hypothetical protein